MIKIKGLNKFFNKGKQNEIHVINDVTLDLPERGMTAIFGKSGCGKTTLLNVIGGLDGFSSGSLTIEDRDICKNTDEIRNKYVGYIFQNYNLNMSESCFDNVAAALRLLGMRDESEIERRVNIALKNVGMENYARRTPDTLSGGQQQRIAIARAIVKNPKIILADEPTGNLDEANTVMIMDLLHKIARDHLVLLVTHEESLVDTYCEKIIELSDGRIVSVREGAATGGASRRSKQDIYLGELDRRQVENEHINLEYYGDAPEGPIDLRIVNKDGRLYLEIKTDRVHIIDGTGEVRLIDGVYQEEPATQISDFDMTDLPEVSGEKFGSLFTLRSSMKSGFVQLFRKSSKIRKTLRSVMILFASLTVMISAFFGSAIGQLMDADDAYNHNVFYLYTDGGEISDVLLGGVGRDNTAIDFVTLNGRYFAAEDRDVYFRVASFDSFSLPAYSGDFSANAVFLDARLAEGKPILAGSGDLPSEEFILLSDKVADSLLEKATLGYMDEYSDLIGITTSHYAVGGKSLRVGGVVETGESAIYLSPMALAREALQNSRTARVNPASDYDIEVKPGETVLILLDDGILDQAPKVGESILLHGESLTVSEIIVRYSHYLEWLKAHETLPTREEYLTSLYPDSDPAEALEEHYFEYDAYQYRRLDEFLREATIVNPDIMEFWLYSVKGITEIKGLYYSAELYKAESFKEQFGRYPTKTEYDEQSENLPSSSEIDVIGYISMYEEEFYSRTYEYLYISSALVSDEDYIKISKRVGRTDPVVAEGPVLDAMTVIHSTNPAVTEAWLNENFGHLTNDYYDVIVTPGDVMNYVIADRGELITGYSIALVAILALMSICMYFIMRSSLMSRIKEVGIYRAIGVSRKNVVFRFMIESAILTALTVLVGYIISSIFVWASIGISQRVIDIFFYPAWYALIVLILLCLLSVVCGILPVIFLLRKTPSEILAKYDV